MHHLFCYSSINSEGHITMPISYGPSASCRIRGWNKSLSQTLEIGNCISSTNSCSSGHWIPSNLRLWESKTCLWGQAKDFCTSYAASELNNYVIMKYVWNMFGFFLSLIAVQGFYLSIYLFAYLLSWDAIHNTEKRMYLWHKWIWVWNSIWLLTCYH